MIHIERTDKSLMVSSPYVPQLPKKARDLGGKWDSTNKIWVFDLRDETRVQRLYEDTYGEWPGAEAIKVDIQLTAIGIPWGDKSSIFFGGREIARAYGRDSGAKLGNGVVVLKGGFDSGGSVKNWATKALEGTVIELRDIPLTMIEKDNSEWEVKVLDGSLDEEALLAEKERLLVRVAEIDILLTKS